LLSLHSFPTRRSSDLVSYNMSSVIGAGPAPFAMVALWQAEGGTIFYCGLYIIGAAILTLVALCWPRTPRPSIWRTSSAESPPGRSEEHTSELQSRFDL